ncbi:amidohydrolase family protein [Gandjariella thermophila]|uniref:Amidohydrolase n=1 Tax=Gandjariella thermophila TaxID=1931992 RepID=A0A4D4J779_9PSEU|nr:amidohydrolase family protein [Gandjariella thermophila]GDY30538.1 amidohydrolase [Gandjariella thermophila]
MVTDGLPLVDQHCHGVRAEDVDRAGFERLLTEAAEVPAHRSTFDSLLGLAVRRWCAPALDLPPHAPAEAYLARRGELGWREVSRRLLSATGTAAWLVDTGLTPFPITAPAELAGLAGGAGYEVVRLEAVAERVAASGAGAAELPGAVLDAVCAAARRAVGLKSVVAYRAGLALPAEPPAEGEVRTAAGRWLAVGGRLTDPVLLAWLVHQGARLGAERGLPLQLHTGFGDPDLRLHRADPALLTDFLAATRRLGGTVVLLHCWPYHRNAAYLAHVFGHVRLDVGLAVPYVGTRADAVLAELFELAPFGALCYASDGFGLPELHHLGALLWRRGLGRLLDRWLAEDVLTAADAERIAIAVTSGNAASAYPLAG